MLYHSLSQYHTSHSTIRYLNTVLRIESYAIPARSRSPESMLSLPTPPECGGVEVASRGEGDERLSRWGERC
eukprot:299255-Rhodomonas_salina.1